MPSAFRLARFVILTTAGLAPVAQPAAAQQGERPWKPAARIQADVRYDDNPFLLSPSQKSKLETVSAGDLQSGRFRDMESVTDVIPVAVARAELAGPGLSGRALQIFAEAAYEANVQNGRRRHAELRLDVEQAFPKAGRLRLRADWRPSYFWKNYLSDAVDLNADGNISAGERIYRPGTSHELDLSLNVRRRLVRSRAELPVTVSGELEVGYFKRGYDAPFAGRDRHGPGVGAGIAVNVGPQWTVGLDYTYQSLHADVVREVQILDETAFGVDFNGTNGASDVDARAFELIDRSRTEHNLKASVERALSGSVTVQLGYARRSRSSSSTQPYDVSDRGRRDTRNAVEGEIVGRLARSLRWRLGAALAKQTTNRAGDPGSTGEVADYTRHVFVAGLQYRF